MAKSNKHKATGAPKKVVKESWWTPQRVKVVIAICVFAIIAAIGIASYNYVSHKQDSVVGSWHYDYQSGDTGENMSILFTFEEPAASGLKACSFVRTREGVEEAQMSGQYSLDEDNNYLTTMLGDDLSTVAIYSYTCKNGRLTLNNVDNGQKYEYVKVTE